MAGYTLLPHENIVMQVGRAFDATNGKSKIDQDHELILTTHHLIYCQLSRLGRKVKNVTYLPLQDIKKYNDRPQVFVKNEGMGRSTLCVVLLNGQKAYEMPTRKANVMIEKIELLYLGEADTLNISGEITDDSIFNDFLDMKESAWETIGDMFRFSKREEKEEAAPHVTVVCDGCGANISGRKGQLGKCSYCGMSQTL